MTRPGRLRRAAAFELAAGTGVVAFWAAFLAAPPPPLPDPALAATYAAFEAAFPAADLALAIALLAAGVALRRGAPWGVPLSLVAAGALVFLGLLDLGFNVRNGVYAWIPWYAAMNVACVGGGIWLAFRVAHERPPDGGRGAELP